MTESRKKHFLSLSRKDAKKKMKVFLCGFAALRLCGFAALRDHYPV